MRRLIPFLAGAALLLAAPSALATTETASSGNVTAKFSYTKESDFRYSHLHLTITRNGATAFDGSTPPSCVGSDCGFWPGGLGQTPSVSVTDLDGNGEPEVIVQLFSGGAHCCVYAEIYSYTGGGYANLEQNFGNAGYKLADLNGDGRPELKSADIRFDEAFTAHAASTEPIQIFDLRAGRLVDVTRSYPALIKKDAASQLKLYKRERKHSDFDVRGILAAYTADEYLLGKQSTANAVLSKALHRGELNRPKDTGFAAGKSYIKRLKKLLKKYGYAR